MSLPDSPTTNKSMKTIKNHSIKLKDGRLVAVVCVGLAATFLSAAIKADVVTDWNETTLATQDAIAGAIRTPPAARALAMVHVAIFDSVNAIDRKYTPYAVGPLADRCASPEAAAAAAAHAVLVKLYPSRQANLDAAYAASLALIPDSSSKTEGISVGESVAALILALRSADGSAVTLPYTLAPGPGVYQPDPAALFVAWGKVTPFALKSGSQFRAKGPPALCSERYAADYNEVKSVGALNSTTRTPDQTEAALFWTPNLQIICNNIARIAAAAHHNSLLENARLFALLNIAIEDTSITVMDTKYTYNFWRPREAIHAGDTDGNDATTADPAWTPLGRWRRGGPGFGPLLRERRLQFRLYDHHGTWRCVSRLRQFLPSSRGKYEFARLARCALPHGLPGRIEARQARGQLCGSSFPEAAQEASSPRRR